MQKNINWGKKVLFVGDILISNLRAVCFCFKVVAAYWKLKEFIFHPFNIKHTVWKRHRVKLTNDNMVVIMSCILYISVISLFFWEEDISSFKYHISNVIICLSRSQLYLPTSRSLYFLRITSLTPVSPHCKCSYIVIHMFITCTILISPHKQSS